MHIFEAPLGKIILLIVAISVIVFVGSFIEYPKEIVIQSPQTPEEGLLEISVEEIEENPPVEEKTENEKLIDVKDSEPEEEIAIEPDIPEETEEASSQAGEEEVVIVVPEEKVPTKSLNQINTDIAGAVMNILCSSSGSGTLESTTGSGVFIDPRGVIITNAHIAQYFLIKDYPIPNAIECVGRIGSPAKTHYTLELLHISKQWVEEHAKDIRIQEPKGTGEHDFAFLVVTGRTDPSAKLPSSFPYVEPNVSENGFKVGEEMLVRSYPAGLLGGISIQKDLYAVATIVKIMKLFTFETTNLDLISIGGSIAAQGGSSGGAVIDKFGFLKGIIVTSSREETTGERDLRAFTLSHIARDLKEYENTTIGDLVSGDVVSKASDFGLNRAPELTKLLTDVLDK
jgi:hypothetical protein